MSRNPRPLPIDRVYLSQEVGEPALSDDRRAVLYLRTADGRRRIILQELTSGLATTVTTEPEPGAGVGYGGGTFAARDGRLVYAARDGRLHGVNLTTGEQWPLTPAAEGVAAPTFSPCGRFVAYLCEDGTRCNVLVVDLHGEHLPVKLSRDPWYAFNPVFSPDGARIAWQEWDECDMPWDQSRLLVARLAGPTRDAIATADIRAAATATLSRPGVSYASPTFSPDGQHLAFTSDETGWRSLWVGDADGQGARRIDTGAGEIGLPDWLPRMSRIGWRRDGREILAVRRAASRDTLLRVAWPEGTCSATEAQVSSISYFASGEDQVAIVGSSPTRPPNLALIDLASGQSRMLATGAVGLIDAASLAAAEQISFSTAGGATAWGNLYSAVGPAAASNPRPLIISVHGGPTSERSLAWDAEAQYFATRGWHYFQLNHRGGSGFGRAVQDALRCQWGVVDVEDARAAAEHLIRLGLADRGRLVITGGSAGGYTTLMALTRDPDLWAAGVSLFGIGDLYELKQGSHRFEVNYELGLVGPLPETGPRWVERSPLSHVDRVRAPVLLFHGTEDKAVPHQQSVDFAEAVRRRGGVAELVSYEGEGHGFRKESNRRDLVERTERFLDKYVLCRQHAAAGG